MAVAPPPVSDLPARGSPPAGRGIIGRIWADRWIYLFILPTAILYGMYTVWPIAASYWYSVLDWNGFESRGDYVGLANYREILRDDFFWSALGNTFLFAIVTVPVRVGLALGVAIMLTTRGCRSRGCSAPPSSSRSSPPPRLSGS